MIRVALTREEGANDALRAFLDPRWDVVEVPATKTAYLDDESFDASVRSLTLSAPSPWLVITSARAARFVPRVLALVQGARVACVGEQSARAVREIGVSVTLVGDAGAAVLAPALAGEIVIVGALARRGELEELLVQRGEAVFELTCYETQARELSPSEQLALKTSDVIFVGAPSAWQVARPWVHHDALVVVPGATTASEVGERYEVLAGWDETLRERLSAWASRREKVRDAEQ